MMAKTFGKSAHQNRAQYQRISGRTVRLLVDLGIDLQHLDLQGRRINHLHNYANLDCARFSASASGSPTIRLR